VGFRDLGLQVALVMFVEILGNMGIIVTKSVVKSTSFSNRKDCRPFILDFPSIIKDPDFKDLADLISQATEDMKVEINLDEIPDDS